MIQILRLHKQITQTQQMLLDSVKKFCIQELQPRVKSDYQNEIVDRGLFKSFGELGIFGPTIQNYNCLGESYTTYGLLAKEIDVPLTVPSIIFPFPKTSPLS